MDTQWNIADFLKCEDILSNGKCHKHKRKHERNRKKREESTEGSIKKEYPSDNDVNVSLQNSANSSILTDDNSLLHTKRHKHKRKYETLQEEPSEYYVEVASYENSPLEIKNHDIHNSGNSSLITDSAPISYAKRHKHKRKHESLPEETSDNYVGVNSQEMFPSEIWNQDVHNSGHSSLTTDNNSALHTKHHKHKRKQKLLPEEMIVDYDDVNTQEKPPSEMWNHDARNSGHLSLTTDNDSILHTKRHKHKRKHKSLPEGTIEDYDDVNAQEKSPSEILNHDVNNSGNSSLITDNDSSLYTKRHKHKRKYKSLPEETGEDHVDVTTPEKSPSERTNHKLTNSSRNTSLERKHKKKHKKKRKRSDKEPREDCIDLKTEETSPTRILNTDDNDVSNLSITTGNSSLVNGKHKRHKMKEKQNHKELTENSEEIRQVEDRPPITKEYMNQYLNLNIEVPFIPPLHHLPVILSREHKEHFLRAGKLTEGPWTRSEVETLVKNMDDFKRIYNVEDLRPLIGIDCPRIAYRNPLCAVRKKFLQFLGQGLPTRAPSNIYYKCRNLLDIKNREKMTPEEEETLLESVEKYGTKWKTISKIMNRTPHSLKEKYRRISVTSTNRGPWSEEEDDRLTKIISKIVGEENFATFNRKALYDLPWKKIARKMKVRSEMQCYDRWTRHLYCSALLPGGEVVNKFTEEMEEALINMLIESGAEYPFQVDWISIGQKLRISPMAARGKLFRLRSYIVECKGKLLQECLRILKSTRYS